VNGDESGFRFFTLLVFVTCTTGQFSHLIGFMQNDFDQGFIDFVGSPFYGFSSNACMLASITPSMSFVI